MVCGLFQHLKLLELQLVVLVVPEELIDHLDFVVFE